MYKGLHILKFTKKLFSDDVFSYGGFFLNWRFNSTADPEFIGALDTEYEKWLLYNEAEKSYAYVAMYDGLIVGYCKINELTDNGTTFFSFNNFIIHPDYRNKRIGTLMMYNMVRHYNSRDMYLSVVKDDIAATKIYERFNFKIYHEHDIGDNGRQMITLKREPSPDHSYASHVQRGVKCTELLYDEDTHAHANNVIHTHRDGNVHHEHTSHMSEEGKLKTLQYMIALNNIIKEQIKDKEES